VPKPEQCHLSTTLWQPLSYCLNKLSLSCIPRNNSPRSRREDGPLIVSLVETCIESSLATRATSLAENAAAVAARKPSPTSASAAPRRDPSTLEAGAGAANLGGGSGGSGIIEDPARAQKTKTRPKAPETKTKKTTRTKTTLPEAPRHSALRGTRRVEVDSSLRASTSPRASTPTTPLRSRPSLWLFSGPSDPVAHRPVGKPRLPRRSKALPTSPNSLTTSRGRDGTSNPSRPLFSARRTRPRSDFEKSGGVSITSRWPPLVRTSSRRRATSSSADCRMQVASTTQGSLEPS
jgi:hypothetical protein